MEGFRQISRSSRRGGAEFFVGGLKEEVLQVRHYDGHLCLTWLSREWQDWADLHNSQEFKDLISKCNTMLEQTKAKGGKSKGKGL